MKFVDFKVAWRILSKEASYSLIVCLGLAVGMALCFLLFGLVRHQYSYDEHIPQNEQIYYVNEFWRSLGESGKTGGVSLPAMQTVLDSGLPIQGTMVRTRNADVRIGEQLQTLKLSLVSSDFASIFSIHAIHGELQLALQRPDTLALSTDAAQKLFGQVDVIGRTLNINGLTYVVRAIIPKAAVNSSLSYDIVAGFGSQFLPDQERRYLVQGWGTWIGQVYFKTADKNAALQITPLMETAFKKSKYYQGLVQYEKKTEGPTGVEFRIGKLRDRNLDPYVSNSPLQNPGILATVSAIASVILLLAMANYLNLTTVRVIRRQREIAVRKVLGASAARLIQQFAAESILVCSLSFALAMLLVWLLLPIFSLLIGLEFPNMFSLSAIVTGIATTIGLALLCSLYPAWVALKIRPTQALLGRGNEESRSGTRLRRALSVLQFSAAMGLTATGLAYAWQGNFLSHLHPGFDSRNIVIVRPPVGANNEIGRSFQEAVLRLSEVDSIASSWSPIRDIDGLDDILRSGQSAAANLYRMGVSSDFFKVYGMKPIAGRIFDQTLDGGENNKKLILNQSAVRKAGYMSDNEAVGSFVRFYNQSFQIIGVVADVKRLDPKQDTQASVFFLDNAGQVLAIKAKHDKTLLQNQIDLLWRRYFPDAVLQITTLEKEYADQQHAESTVTTFINLTSIVALLIAAFGIYALAAYSVQRRTREIVLRKIHGARNGAIAKLLSKEFLYIVGVAATIGLPFAYLKIEQYLSHFRDIAPIGLWTLLIAAVIGNLVALASTIRHAIIAMRLSPSLAFRED